jgi:exoribonuclease II
MALKLPQIVEIRQHGKVLAVAALEDKGGRIRAVGVGGRPTSFPAQRVLCATGVAVPSEGEAVAAVEEYEREQERRLGDTDTVTLWELASEAWRTATLAQLASLLGEPGADGATQGLVLRAIVADRLHFKIRADDVLIHTPDEVEAALQREEEARLRQILRDETIAWLRGDLDNRPEGADSLVDTVRDLAAASNQPPAKHAGATLMRDAGLRDTPASAFRTLVARDVFEPDVNLLRIRYGMDRPFSGSVRAEADQLAGAGFAVDDRVDLRDLNLTAIDDPGTTEIDDALSLEARADGWRVGVHLAEPGAVVPGTSGVDREAARRQTTLYLPRGKRLMLPSVLSEGAASLIPGADRPALSVIIDLDAAGSWLGAKVVRSVVRIGQTLSYDEVDARLDTDSELGTLVVLAEALRSQRLAGGALDTRLPEVNPSVGEGGAVDLWVVEATSRARAMVAEWMVRANGEAARLLWDARVSVVYRCQELKRPLPQEYDPEDRLSVYRATRCLGQTLLDAVPRRHAGLGLDAYVQITSPLRRYMDLVTQRQLSAHLAGEEPPLDAEAMAAAVALAQPVLSHAQIVRGGTRQFWLTRWLEQHAGAELDAVVLDTAGRRVRIEIEALSWRRMIRPSRPLEPGQRIRLRVSAANARDEQVELELLPDPVRT